MAGSGQTGTGPLELMVSVARAWVEDPESSVVWTGELEGRIGVRMSQQVRDFTTVWFEIGQRTLGYEAYVAPPPPHRREEIYRQLLARNRRGWRTHFALDAEGAIVVRGRIPIDRIDAAELDAILGSIYDLVETSFPSIVGREKTSCNPHVDNSCAQPLVDCGGNVDKAGPGTRVGTC